MERIIQLTVRLNFKCLCLGTCSQMESIMSSYTCSTDGVSFYAIKSIIFCAPRFWTRATGGILIYNRNNISHSFDEDVFARGIYEFGKSLWRIGNFLISKTSVIYLIVPFYGLKIFFLFYISTQQADPIFTLSSLLWVTHSSRTQNKQINSSFEHKFNFKFSN